MSRIRNLAILNATAFVLHLLCSFLVQLKLINQKDVGEISDNIPSLFTPAGFTFIIWSVIYAALLAFCIYHIIIAYRANADHPSNKDISATGALFIINNLATAAWLIVWVQEMLTLSVVLILLQLTTLIMIHSRLNIHDATRNFSSKVFTQFPLSIYLGWISIACIANISTWLTSVEWSGWGVSAINWTITMIAIAVMLTVGVINRKKNIFFGLVVLWALYGIMSKRISADREEYEPIIMLIRGGMVIVALACLFGLIRNLRTKV